MEQAVGLETLRQQLKEWERSFSARQSRKPTREDIKANAEIASKYSTYAQLANQRPGRADTSQSISKRQYEPSKRKAKYSSDEKLVNEPAKRRRFNDGNSGSPSQQATPTKNSKRARESSLPFDIQSQEIHYRPVEDVTTPKTRRQKDTVSQTPFKSGRQSERIGQCKPVGSATDLRSTCHQLAPIKDCASDQEHPENTPRNQTRHVDPTPQRNGRLIGIFDIADEGEEEIDDAVPSLLWDGSSSKSGSSLARSKNLANEAIVSVKAVSEKEGKSRDAGDTCVQVHLPQPHDYDVPPIEIHRLGQSLVTPKKAKLGPRESALHLPEATPSNPLRHGKTPPSSGRKFALAYALGGQIRAKDGHDTTVAINPSHPHQRDIEDSAGTLLTPESKPIWSSPVDLGEKHRLETPSFLRSRLQVNEPLSLQPHTQEADDEDGEAVSCLETTPSKRRPLQPRRPNPSMPSRMPWLRSGLLGKANRSFRELIREVRNREDERLDEQQQIMDEMNEEDGTINDSDEADDPTQQNRNANPWRRKKGAKRQTRKLNLKPKPAVVHDVSVASDYETVGKENILTIEAPNLAQVETISKREARTGNLHESKASEIQSSEHGSTMQVTTDDAISPISMKNRHSRGQQSEANRVGKKKLQPLNLVRLKHLSRGKGKKMDRARRFKARKTPTDNVVRPSPTTASTS